MTFDNSNQPGIGLLANELTRRKLLAGSGILATAGAMSLPAAPANAAADGTPVAVDPAKLQTLTDLSQTLCGGGTFNSDRATKLYQLVYSDPALESGCEQLLSTPPVAGQPITPDSAKTTAEVILDFWYADTYNGNPIDDRGSAYYQLTSWQAMYTFCWGVCHMYGGWADEPQDDSIVPANNES